MTRFFLMFRLLLSVAAPQVTAAELAQEMPEEWGQVTVQTQGGCLEISGHYDLIGKVVPETPGFIGTLNYILQAAIPSVIYQPNVERFAILESIQDQQMRVTIMMGEATRSTIKEVSCERGWLRVEKKGESGAEGNTVRFHTTSLMKKNYDGDLVVQYSESANSSTLFGLLKSKSVDRYWLLFPRHRNK